MKKFIFCFYILFILILVGTITHAATTYNSYFCNSAQQYIKIGDTQQQVLALCGQPISSIPASSIEPQIWTYAIISSHNIHYNILNGSYVSSSNPLQPTQIHFTIEDNKVVDIHNGTFQVSQTSGCQGGPVKVGDSERLLKKKCGYPTYVNYNPGTNPVFSATSDILVYKNPYGKDLVLHFQQGLLKRIILQ